MGAEELQPIEWRVWAGKVERERKEGPYLGLEERMGFVDIRVRETLPSRMRRSMKALNGAPHICRIRKKPMANGGYEVHDANADIG